MTFDERVRKYISDLVNTATGGDASRNEELGEAYRISRDFVLSVLRKARVPLDRRLIEDIDRALEGEEPQFFVPADHLVERYREHHHPDVNFGRLQRLGLLRSFAPYLDDEACVKEQRFFYKSDEWKDRSTMIRIMDRFTCKNCGRNAREKMLHVHHTDHIYSAFSRMFHRNFDSIYLRCLCELCHKNFHDSHVRGYSHFISAQPDEVRQSREWRDATEQLHNAAQECLFCFPRTFTKSAREKINAASI